MPFTRDAVDVFNPVTAGGEPRGADMGEAQAWGVEMQYLANLAYTSSLVYSARSALYANLVPGANTPALVIGDATAGYDGLYMKNGATTTGSWTKLGDVPGYNFIRGSDSGAGTANAIQVTAPTIPAADGVALIAFNVFEANTSSPVTVSFNGATALTIKTNSGDDIVAGGLAANMIVLGFKSGSTFRLLSDQASSVISAELAAAVAAAEAAQAAAEDAAAEAAATLASKADLDSPVFTGEPEAPTAAPGTSTTQVATTEFAHGEVEARVGPMEIRVFLAPTNYYLAEVRVDRNEGEVSFPPMVIQSDEVTSAATANTGDTFVTLALSTSNASRIYYYIDRADSRTIKSSTDPLYGASKGDVVALGYSQNYAFQSTQGHRVRHTTYEKQNFRITARPNSLAGLSMDKIIVDRVAGTVKFPSLQIWRPNALAFTFVDPPSWPVTSHHSMPLNADTGFAYATYYFITLSTGLFSYVELTSGTYASDWNTPLQSDDVICIGASLTGSFVPHWGLQVDYVQNDRPPMGLVSMEAVARHMQAAAPPDNYTAGNGYAYAGTKWHAVQPAFKQDTLRVTAAGKIDLSYFPPASRLMVRTYGSTSEFWAGRGRTFLGQGSSNKAEIPANSFFAINSSFGDLILEPIVGTPAYSTISEPVMDRSILLAGQSQRVIYGTNGGIGGFMRACRNAAWVGTAIDEAINWIHGATGGTAIDRRSVGVGPTNYWWDAEADGGAGEPGPALVTCIDAIDAAISAGQPAPDWVFWALGETDAIALDSGALTVAQATASLIKVWDYIRANGATGAQFLVSPVGCDDFTVEKGFSGSRAAVLGAIAGVAYAYQGVDYYDMPRHFQQVHLMDIGYAAWGYREAKAYANLEHAQTNDLGPAVTGITLSANKKIATLTFDKEGPLYIPPGTVSSTVVAGPYPMGFGVVPSSNAAGVPAALIRGYVSGADIVLESDTSLVGKRILFPYGHFPNHRSAQFMRDYQSDDYHGLPGIPMRTFLSDALS